MRNEILTTLEVLNILKKLGEQENREYKSINQDKMGGIERTSFIARDSGYIKALSDVLEQLN